MAPIYESAATRKEPRWANLVQELVETIARRLPLEDYYAFGLVCKSWWSAMITVRALIKPPPILILKRGHPCEGHLHLPGDRARQAEATCFYALCGGGEHRKLPMMRNSLSTSHGVPAARCCGASMGWLFMVDIKDESRVHLLNPISGEKVELPTLPPYYTVSSYDEVLCSTSASDRDCIVVLKGNMEDQEPLSEEMHRFPVLLTCRPKDDQWRRITYRSWVYTFALYEGRLHVVDRHGMDIYDLDPGPRKTGSVIFDDGWRKTNLVTLHGIILVIMDGKLLLVCGAFNKPHRVYELVDNRWVRTIHSLGEWVFLTRRFTSHAFSTKDSPMLGFRANCIYQLSIRSIIVYSMEDESCVTISLPTDIGPSFAGDWLQFYWVFAQSWV